MYSLLAIMTAVASVEAYTQLSPQQVRAFDFHLRTLRIEREDEIAASDVPPVLGDSGRARIPHRYQAGRHICPVRRGGGASVGHLHQRSDWPVLPARLRLAAAGDESRVSDSHVVLAVAYKPPGRVYRLGDPCPAGGRVGH